MYVCCCNPFTDRDVKAVIGSGATKNTPGQIYKACTGGKKPNCGNCVCMIKDIMAENERCV